MVHSPRPKQIAIALSVSAIALIVGIKVAPAISSKILQNRINRANIEIASFDAGLGEFERDVGRYPSIEEGLAALLARPQVAKNWHGPYVSKDVHLIDPWNRPYFYTYPGRHCEGGFELFSLGPDGLEGTTDDIVGVSDPNS